MNHSQHSFDDKRNSGPVIYKKCNKINLWVSCINLEWIHAIAHQPRSLATDCYLIQNHGKYLVCLQHSKSPMNEHKSWLYLSKVLLRDCHWRAADGDGLRQYNGTNNGELVQKGEQTRYVSKTEFWNMNASVPTIVLNAQFERESWKPCRPGTLSGLTMCCCDITVEQLWDRNSQPRSTNVVQYYTTESWL